MIQLTIKHSFFQDGTKAQPRATYFLRDHNDPHFSLEILEERFCTKRLSDLARTWFQLHRTGNEQDVNEQLLSGYPNADANLKDLLPLPKPGYFKFACDDPIIIAALDERVKRACAMIVEAEVYEEYLKVTDEVCLPLSDPRARLSSGALPEVDPSLRKKATERA